LNRLQRKRLLAMEKRRAAAYLLFMLLLLSGFWIVAVLGGDKDAAVTAAAVQEERSPSDGFWQNVVYKAMPYLEASQEDRNWEDRLFGGLRDTFYFFTQVKPQDLRTVLRSEIAALAADKAPTSAAVSRKRGADAPKAKKKPVKNGKVLVGIYHTHTAESFLPSSGRTHSPGGQQGEIVAVGRALVETLEREGVAAIQSENIHDYPSFMRAYGASEETVVQMLEKYKDLVYIFDVHRDAESRANVTTRIDGETIASISIIVAQGQEGLEQPHWRKNYAAAKKLKDVCDEKYPGLIREIQFAEWRYNEHLHNGLLILEVGSHETSCDEAVKAITYFGEALAEVLRKERG